MVGARSRSTRFNGAAHFRARKFGGLSAAILRPIASMGPRTFARGNDRRNPYRCRGPHRFNGAAHFRARKFARTILMPVSPALASMGPRTFARGNIFDGACRSVDAGASMGPRTFARGNHGRSTSRPSVQAASMGPRTFARGNGVLRSANHHGHFCGTFRAPLSLVSGARWITPPNLQKSRFPPVRASTWARCAVGPLDAKRSLLLARKAHFDAQRSASAVSSFRGPRQCRCRG